ncbi:hypothetical protein CROQUDRAFT_90383 [Cronartium quercuum f. sp. fusiforme G11]|uniref:Uncharacterized protein n=1 Tax=Cronartium quercuum f. sp. fusiforme G11 TaxID=708437 RepID=A0A9P6NK20_9BASI|nr:hypothetical protein CROQUDRAFT_90383 [Cronartium quercuum f. sp. fusiforme G11]
MCQGDASVWQPTWLFQAESEAGLGLRLKVNNRQSALSYNWANQLSTRAKLWEIQAQLKAIALAPSCMVFFVSSPW